MSLRTASEIQREYYRRTAAAYNDLHVAECGEHEEALLHVAAYIRAMHARSVLDVGAGTGRALSFLRSQLAPGVRLHGIEPVPELIAQARTEGIGPETLSEGDGASLPFADAEFDVVLETGVLHHVAEPARVLAEVTRVARRAIFVSDSNRFGQGPIAARLMKLGLCRMGLWRAFTLVRTRGRGYMVSDGDGLFYSYSVYDNLEQISRWADRLFVVPVGRTSKGGFSSWLGPILTSGTVLLCAFRDPPGGASGLGAFGRR
jgi:SAM-dependent methyltransferase